MEWCRQQAAMAAGQSAPASRAVQWSRESAAVQKAAAGWSMPTCEPRRAAPDPPGCPQCGARYVSLYAQQWNCGVCGTSGKTETFAATTTELPIQR